MQHLPSKLPMVMAIVKKCIMNYMHRKTKVRGAVLTVHLKNKYCFTHSAYITNKLLFFAWADQRVQQFYNYHNV